MQTVVVRRPDLQAPASRLHYDHGRTGPPQSGGCPDTERQGHAVRCGSRVIRSRNVAMQLHRALS